MTVPKLAAPATVSGQVMARVSPVSRGRAGWGGRRRRGRGGCGGSWRPRGVKTGGTPVRYPSLGAGSNRPGPAVFRGGRRHRSVTTTPGHQPSRAPVERSSSVSVTVPCPQCARAFAFDVSETPVQRAGAKGSAEWLTILAYY